MKRFLIWFLSFIITLSAAYYQRKTGPTYPRQLEITANGKVYPVKLIRSLGIDERPEVRLALPDTSVKARLFYKRFRTGDDYSPSDFDFKVYPVDSYVMNKIFGITEERGLFARLPVEPVAGKLQYYIEVSDSNGTKTYLQRTPVVLRFKGSVPSSILAPHILIMFLAMFFSTLAGLMAVFGVPEYRKYSLWTLFLILAGGILLGPVVQKYAFGEFWTGVPFGWDLTDNKTLIATVFWLLAVLMNRRKKTPAYTILAAFVLLLVFSIPHSLLGSELNYESGKVTQGLVLVFFGNFVKKNKLSAA
jgi:hypothetical protein